jgi:hypothetical protein
MFIDFIGACVCVQTVVNKFSHSVCVQTPAAVCVQTVAAVCVQTEGSISTIG